MSHASVSQPVHLYAEANTCSLFDEPLPKVLLPGSFAGYPNFGDIMQLRGVLSWHRQVTRLEPIAISEVEAVTDRGFLDRLRRALGVRGILVCASNRVDVSALGLVELTEPMSAESLHVHGGGFLNSIWGRSNIALIETLLQRFGIGHYVLSGQQVDPEIGDLLAAHFSRFAPVLAGARDDASLDVLRACGVPCGYSFDDAAEALLKLSESLKADTGDIGDSSLLIHLNLSAYTLPSASESSHEPLDRLRKRLLLLREAFPKARVTLINAYNDCRIRSVCDTLGVVQRLDATMPFRQHGVVHLGACALDGAAGVSPIFTRNSIAYSCSYHVALACSLAGVPCFLDAANAYYRQKRAGLGEAQQDFDAFLRTPVTTGLANHLTRRRDWLNRLEECFRSRLATPGRAACAAPAQQTGAATASWRPKGEMDLQGESRAGSDSSAGESAASPASEARATERAIRDLKASLDDARRGRDWHAQQEGNYKKIADERQGVIDELRRWSAQLAEGRDWHERQAANWKAVADERQTVIDDLKRWTSQLDEARRWLEQQNANWKNLADERERRIEELRAWIARLEADKLWLEQRAALSLPGSSPVTSRRVESDVCPAAPSS